MNGREKNGTGAWGPPATPVPPSAPPGQFPRTPANLSPPPQDRSSGVLAAAATGTAPPTPGYRTDENGLLRPGTVLGKYQIVRPLGSGGMGAVYEAVHTGIGKPVALKTMNAALASDPRAEQRFLREAAASSRLEHPHVVDVTDFGSDHGVIYIVMELMRGEDLAALIARAPAGLDYTFVVDVMLPVCAGVFAAHSQGVIHRDLKPQNIFLARTALGDFVPKVLDFGISKLMDEKGVTALTNSGSVMGTTHYLSPEQVTGQPVDARSDEHALGVILYECLTGRRPHDGETIFTIMRSISEGKYARPLSLRPDLPPPLEAVVMRTMAMRPDDRFPTVHALGRALLPFASSKGRIMWAEYFERGSAGPPPGTSYGAPSPRTSSWMSGAGVPVPPTTPGRLPSGETRSGVRPVSVMGTNEFQPRDTSSRWRKMAVGVLLIGGAVAAWMILGPPKTLQNQSRPGLTGAPGSSAPMTAPHTEPSSAPIAPPATSTPSGPNAGAKRETKTETKTETETEARVAAPPAETEASVAPSEAAAPPAEAAPREAVRKAVRAPTPQSNYARPRPLVNPRANPPRSVAPPKAKARVRRAPPPEPPPTPRRRVEDPVDEPPRLSPGGAPIID
jgi:serine/threonine protein kinase